MQIKLSEIKEGKLEANFAYEMEKVIQNCLDENTDLKARKVTIDISVVPKKNDREKCEIGFIVKSKLRPVEAEETTVFIGRTDGGYDMVENSRNELKGQMVIDTETGEVLEGPSIQKPSNKLNIVG